VTGSSAPGNQGGDRNKWDNGDHDSQRNNLFHIDDELWLEHSRQGYFGFEIFPAFQIRQQI
jgi:hypothetical protein